MQLLANVEIVDESPNGEKSFMLKKEQRKKIGNILF